MRFSKTQLQKATQRAATRQKLKYDAVVCLFALAFCFVSSVAGVLCQHYFGVYEWIFTRWH